VQVTASALTGAWGQGVGSTAKWLLEHDAVHVLASDAHDSVYRTPVLSAGRTVAAELCGQDIARALVDDNPLAIISGKPLPYFPEPVRKSSG
jgi:protein-tyrosine phosphatase